MQNRHQPLIKILAVHSVMTVSHIRINIIPFDCIPCISRCSSVFVKRCLVGKVQTKCRYYPILSIYLKHCISDTPLSILV